MHNVIENMLMLADYYNLDKNMAYVIASFHDIGLNVDRENHEQEAVDQAADNVLQDAISAKRYVETLKH